MIHENSFQKIKYLEKPQQFIFNPYVELELQKLNSDWNVANGGFVSYLTKDEDEELLTIAPKANSLSLVFRDEDTLRFVKYLNAKCQDDYFYDVFGCYYEQQSTMHIGLQTVHTLNCKLEQFLEENDFSSNMMP